MTPEFFEQAAHMDNLLVLTKEQAAATAKALRHLAALERENVTLRQPVEPLVQRVMKLKMDNARLRKASAELVALKDGPRDAYYQARKEPAWQALREALEGTDG